jgi:hypothetical protein
VELLVNWSWPRWRSDRVCSSIETASCCCCCRLQGVDGRWWRTGTALLVSQRSGEVVHVQSGVRGSVLCCGYVTSVIQSRSVLVTCGVVEWSEQSTKAWNAWTAASMDMDELALIHFHELSRSQPARAAPFSNRIKNAAALSCCCRLVRRDGNLASQESRTRLARSGSPYQPAAVLLKRLFGCSCSLLRRFHPGPPLHLEPNRRPV